MSRMALQAIEKSGPEKKLVNLIVDGAPLSPPRSVWKVLQSMGEQAGIVTSQTWSPTKQANLAFAIVQTRQADPGNALMVDSDGDVRNAVVHNSSWQLP